MTAPARTARAVLLLILMLLSGAAAAAEGTLAINARLAESEPAQPVRLIIAVGPETIDLGDDGAAEVVLAPGTYPLTVEIAGAVVDGPSEVTLREGERTDVTFVVTPVVELTLEAFEAPAGGQSVLRARATTGFATIIPGTISVTLPEGWRAEGATRVLGGLGAGVPLTLEVRLRTESHSGGVAAGTLGPWGATAQAELNATRPATFDLRPLVSELTGAPGDELHLPVGVTNLGDEAGEVTLALRETAHLPAPTAVHLDLAAGEQRTIILPVVVPDVTERIRLRPYLSTAGRTVAEAEVPLRALRPNVTLSQSVTHDRVVPGEVIAVRLTVANAGETSTAYTLTAQPPEWLEPLDAAPAPRFQGVLEPGSETTHAYEARVLYGPAAASAIVAELRFEDVTTATATELERRLVTLTSDAEALTVAGATTAIAVIVENPLGRPLSLLLRRAVEGADLHGPAETTLELAPHERRSLAFEVGSENAGSARHTLSLLHEGTPVAATVSTAVTTKPELVPVRSVAVRVPFTAEGADTVLIRHSVPGATVIAGSSRLDGQRVPDPLVDANGRAYWLLAAESGELTYRALVTEELPADLPAPELTAIYADREVQFAGAVRLSDLPEAGPADHHGTPEDAGSRSTRAASPAGDSHVDHEAASASESSGLIVEPAAGARFRDVDRVRIVVVGPATGDLPEVKVNGQPVGRDRVGLIQTDATSGTHRVEYYAITLQSGENLIEARVGETTDSVEVYLAGRPARLEVTAVEAVSNGRTPVRATLTATDANGVPTGFGPVTLVTDLRPAAADAFPELPGYQVLMRDGYAVAEFEPLVTAREIELTARYETLTATARVLAVPTREALYHFHGSARFGVSEGVTYLAGSAQAYAELPTERGLLQLALDGRAHATAFGETTGASGLAPRAPDARYPVLGVETTARPTFTSEDAIAFRYTEPGLEVSYAYGDHMAPGAGAAARLTAFGIDAELTDGLSVAGFAGLAPAALVEEVITPDGTRRYQLRHVPRSGGETVLVRVQTADGMVLEESVLVAGRDYTVDTTVGAITLARPLLPTTDGLEDKRLVVRYAPREAAREEPAFGAGLSYRMGPVSAALGGARVVTDAGAEYRVGAEAGYHVDGFGVDARYLRTHPSSGAATDRFEATLYLQDDDWLVRGSATLEGELHSNAEVAYASTGGPWSVNADVATDATRGLTGGARLAYDLPGVLGLAALEHDRTPGRDVTGLVYEHALDALVAGLGVGWDWQGGAAEALARAGYQGEAVSVDVEHRQPFTADRQARSELSAGLALAGGTDLRATVDTVWGGDVSGRLELIQPFGPARAAVTYELPTSGGEGNRLQFGIDTPLALSDALSVDLSGSYARSFASGANRFSVGAAAGYAVEEIQASGAVELALTDGAPKLVARFGATGNPAPEHTLRFAGDFQVLPEFTGTLDLAYSYSGRALNVLTYHRLVADDDASVEGEAAFTIRPNPSWQVRPSAAYRVLLADMGGTMVQLGAGLTAYPLEHVGLGANGYYLIQPFGGESAFIWGLEGSYRIDEGTAVAAGYSFGDSAGLTPESRGGWYVRLDVFGGNR